MQFTAAAGYLGPARVDFVLIGPAGPSVPAAVQITVVPAAGPLEAGDAYGLASAQADAAMRMARDRMSDLHGHMRKLRASDCLSNAVAFSLTGPAKSSGEAGTTASVESAQCSTLAQGDVGIWATGSLSFGTWEDTSFAEALDHASRSLTLGMDYRLSDRAIAGIALSLGRDVTDIGTTGSETTNRSTAATLYLTYGLDNDLYVDGLIGAAALDFSSRRWVAADGAFALGERDGRQVYFSVALGKDFSTETRDLEGYLRISGSRSVLEGFTETGTLSALRFDEQEVKSLVGAIGFATSTELSLPTGTLRPSVTGELSHEFADAGTVGVSYAGLGVGTLFQRDAATRSRTELSLGVGFDFQHMNGWQLDGEVGLRVNGDGVADTSVKLNWQMQF